MAAAGSSHANPLTDKIITFSQNRNYYLCEGLGTCAEVMASQTATGGGGGNTLPNPGLRGYRTTDKPPRVGLREQREVRAGNS